MSGINRVVGSRRRLNGDGRSGGGAPEDAVPATAILDEDEDPILDEDGNYILEG